MPNTQHLSAFLHESGCATSRAESCHSVAKRDIKITLNNIPEKIGDGSVVIAAITSCTNTSNPYVLVGAGLMAKEAVRRGLRVPAYVKTSFAPGSSVVSDLPRGGRPAPLFGGPRLSYRRLRLHHLHRQQRPAATPKSKR